MGTHPIFESDFDCLTNSSRMSVEEAFEFLKAKTSSRPKIGIVCGSGLSGLGEKITDKLSIDYKDIPNFPVSTVQGHKGCLVFGKLGGKEVICMQGRFHLYEGWEPKACTIPIRVMKLFGVEKLILTNAAGGLNAEYKVGDFMILKDHLFLPGLCGFSPLVGRNDDSVGPRFPPLGDAYDRELQADAKAVAKEMGEEVKNGVYMCQFGPCYETVAEMRLALAAGVDALGMSTAYEVCAARHAGIKCFAVSLITNKCHPTYDVVVNANHEEVIEVARERGAVMVDFITRCIGKW